MILDNKIHGKVGDKLKENLEKGSRLSILSSLFSVFGYHELKKELDKVEKFRMVIPNNPAGSQVSEDGDYLVDGLTGSKADRPFRNKLNITRIAKECADWLSSKGKIKAANIPIPQNLFHVNNPDGNQIAIHGSSPFSNEGFGFVGSDSFHMNTCFTSDSETQNLLNWFDSIWDNTTDTIDIKANLLNQLRDIYSDKSPKQIYYLVLYNIFKDFLGEIEEENIIKTKTGIKDTVVWNKLYKFQSDGVIGAIDKIERYNGCIIADSVGLGKTFEALAIIKYYELRNDRVLVLCPKKLRENWSIYTINDKRNLLATDRFNYDVLNHTDLTRTSGKSGEINLETLNWGNYDLIVIDESHNFRNNPSKKEGLTRYSRLMKEIIKAGVRTKVLMLSATPVNSRMNDLKNQVAFITEGIDDSLFDQGIPSIEQTLKKAQTHFNRWLKQDIEQRTTESLLEELNFDYFKLLDLMTIARSRKHIEKYYDITEIGEFPKRLKPLNIKTDIDINGTFPPLSEGNRDIRRLNLSAYAPLKYVLPEKMEQYNRKYDMKLAGGSVFKQIDREQNLIHLIRVNLFKRMESSIHSFTLTLEKLLSGVRELISRIEDHQVSQIDELNIEEIEVFDDEYTPFVVGSKKIRVLIQDVDKIKWKQELQEDEEILMRLLSDSKSVTSSEDAKLNHLKDLISDKIDHPLNPANKKIIVFTAFADTAQYLYQNISGWVKKTKSINSALVTGGGNNKTTMAGIRSDLASIITSFSPISKERDLIDSSLEEEIDLLIATDCISEGQNLQDCDYLVNYDIHWNPVRIIQRFGRIDRLGSKNKSIQLVNFWPNMELDEYINLEARVSGRMVLLDISATGEENVIEYADASKMNDLEYRRKQLEKLQNEVVDIEDLGSGISITDLTLNDFRMDLADYLKESSDNIQGVPLGVFAVTPSDNTNNSHFEPGVIFCLRCENSKTQMDHTYSLAPNYLVYVSNDGDIILNFHQTRKILDNFKKLAINQRSVDRKTMELFEEVTRGKKDMSHFQGLLAKAVAAITGKAEEVGVESLFQRGGTIMEKDSFKGIDDFEVVAYIVILENTIEKV